MTPFSALMTGVSVQAIGKYRPQNYIGWAFMLLAFGILTLLDEHSSRAMYLGCQILLGVGLGIVFVAPEFPILAPLPVSNNAHALAFFIFVRTFFQVRLELDMQALSFGAPAHTPPRRRGASPSARRCCRTSSARASRAPSSPRSHGC